MKWEYATRTLYVSGWRLDGEVDPVRVNDTLNIMGDEGWELVSSFSTTTGKEGASNLVFIFKRQKFA